MIKMITPKSYVKLFEEFTRKTGVPFIEKLHLFAQASDIPTRLTEIEDSGVDTSFKIDTKIPGDFNGGTKSFKVVIPFNMASPYVETYETGKMVLKTGIESVNPENTTPEINIFLNYVEVTQLFNDPVVEMLGDNFHKFKDPEEIKTAIKNYG